MHKIQRVSLGFRIIFQSLFIFIPLMQVVAWIMAPQSIHFLAHVFQFDVIPHMYQAKILHTLTASDKVLGLMVSMIPTGVSLFCLYFLIKLFKLYERGEIFSALNVNYIRKIGYVLVIGQLLNPLYEALMGIVLTIQNPPGQRMFGVAFTQNNIEILIFALLLLLVSWIMAEGHKLREEQQLTV